MAEPGDNGKPLDLSAEAVTSFGGSSSGGGNSSPPGSGLNVETSTRFGSIVDVVEDETATETSSEDVSPKQSPRGRILPQFTEETSDVIAELQEVVDRVQRGETTSLDWAKVHLKNMLQAVTIMAPVSTRLTEIVLYENGLLSLPDELFQATPALVTLDVSNNRLSTLPPSITTVVSLERILADHNEITVLPDGMRNLVNLKQMGLEWNDLLQFPTELCEISGLQQLFLVENEHVQSFPPLDVMKNWTKIVLSVDNRPKLILDAQTKGIPDANENANFDLSVKWNKIYPDKVGSFIFLGSMRTAQCVDVYNDLDIGYVLTAGRNLDVVIGENMKQLELHFDDVPGQDPSPFFDKAFTFIEEAKASSRGVLVHCFAGLSRSVTITIAYLMKTQGLTRDEGLAVVRQSRPAATPNEGFMDALLRYEHELRKQGIIRT